MGETLLRLEMTDYFGRKRRDRMLKNTSGHYIVCGAGRVGRSVINELLRSRASVVLIDNRIDRAGWATDKGVVTLVAITGRDEKKLYKAAEMLHAVPIRADVTNEADITRTYREVFQAFADLD